MKKSINKSKIFMIVSICVLCVSLIGGTVAYYVRELFATDEQKTITYGLDYYINYAEGQDVVSETLNPTPSYEGSPSSDIELWKKDDTYDIYGHIYLDINSMSDILSKSGALKYAVINNGNIISEGTIFNNKKTLLLSFNIPLETSRQLYRVHIWLDDNMSLDYQMSNEELSLSVRCEATMKEMYGTATKYISNLYLNNKNKVVTNNKIEYQYAQSVNLMNDRLGGTTSDYDAGNIRYYGINPNNYVDIGDRDSSGNVILYRIIGLFKDVELSDGTKQDLIKVIRSNTIGEYSFDNKPSGVGSSDSNNGSNDWTDARLMMLLNPGYDVYDEDNPLLDTSGDTIYGYEGSLWWNSKRGTCYSGSSGATKTCDFTKNGLSVSAQSNIETVVWPLGAHTIVGAYSDAYYKSERGTAVFAGKSTKWTGKVSMMYSSDYGYAADLDVCKSSLQSYNNTACKNSNWLWTGITDLHLTPNSAYSYFSYYNKADAAISDYGASYAPKGVRPVFYLNANLYIISGSGTINDPYVF